MGANGHRFIECEKWRASYGDVGVEELVRTFDYKERPEIFKYYPQYYHKTDKVRLGAMDLTAHPPPAQNKFQARR